MDMVPRPTMTWSARGGGKEKGAGEEPTAPIVDSGSPLARMARLEASPVGTEAPISQTAKL